MHRMIRRTLTSVATLPLLLVAGPALAGAPTDQLKSSIDQVIKVIEDTSLHKPLIGFGAAGAVTRTPVIFIHGNNDTPFPTACNPFCRVQAFAQYFADARKTRVPYCETRVIDIRGRTHRLKITVQGNEPTAPSQSLQNRAAMSAASECAIHVNAVALHVQRVDRLDQHYGAMQLGAQSEKPSSSGGMPSSFRTTTYTLPSGEPIKLTPGRTWLELVPRGNLSAL